MINNNLLQIIIYFSILLLLTKPIGLYIAWIYTGNYENKPYIIIRILKYIEQWIYSACHVSPKQLMNWKDYAKAILIFNFLGFLVVYVIQRLQILLPLNHQHFNAVSQDIAFNTAASFITNTNWQAYAPESTLSCFTQMVALTVQNFMSAATGLSVLMVLIRGIKQCETYELGNFWVDLVRGVLYIFIPFSIVLSLLLVSQGVPQNFKNYQNLDSIAATKIPMGPVASQVAIKQLGTNGGGYFNANSAHPFENPTPFSNFLEMLAIILIPAALCVTFGSMIKDPKQGRALLIVMFLILIPCVVATISIEEKINIKLINTNNINNKTLLVGSNMEGKEVRFGGVNSGLWATLTTATSNGSVNSMHDSFLPLGGLVPIWLITLGEIIFGGVGSGLYQMLIFVIITVFVSGLMVGRTPEYLGKKIEAFEIKMASFAILIAPIMILVFTAIALMTVVGRTAISNPGSHGFTEILYAFSSMLNNNGSSFAGLKTNAFYNLLGGLGMLIRRYWIIIPTLAIAGSLAKKKIIPNSIGTLPTANLLFIGILVSFIMIMVSLIFLPAFALGPIVEQLMMIGY